jgi:transcriptional regulator with XRE-family HTH domain
VSEQELRGWTAVGEALVARRKAQKMTQKQLHDAADVSIFVISEIEKVSKIRDRGPGTLGRLSGALDWPENHLDNILSRHLNPGLAAPEQSASGLTPAEKAFLSFGEKLDKINGKLDALLKHYDIVWQPGESSGTSVDLAGYDHGREPPQPEDGAPAPMADE